MVNRKTIYAGVAELADATDLKSVVRKNVRVRTPSPVPKIYYDVKRKK